jgi:cyclophilin family peptidyl-prolyl cis-trans isomerase
MMNAMRFPSFFILFLFAACGQEKSVHAILHTGMGDISIELFSSTPHHRDNFLLLFDRPDADTLTFYRIERDFAIQFGPVPDSTQHDIALEPEISAPMLGGALAAPLTGQDGYSDGTDFFIVMDRPQNETSLDRAEQKIGRRLDTPTRAAYQKYGGLPLLHGKHTVFGRVTGGMEVAQKIAALPRDAEGRPLKEVKVWVEVR